MVENLKLGGAKVEHLDGDLIRHIFPKTGFSRQERELHIERVGYVASLLEKNEINVVVTLISPYRASREFVRKLCKNFIEVYIATPLAICEKRDVKGLYAKARSGAIQNFTGISDPYEPPLKAELILNTEVLSITQSVDKILQHLNK